MVTSLLKFILDRAISRVDRDFRSESQVVHAAWQTSFSNQWSPFLVHTSVERTWLHSFCLKYVEKFESLDSIIVYFREGGNFLQILWGQINCPVSGVGGISKQDPLTYINNQKFFNCNTTNFVSVQNWGYTVVFISFSYSTSMAPSNITVQVNKPLDLKHFTWKESIRCLFWLRFSTKFLQFYTVMFHFLFQKLHYFLTQNAPDFNLPKVYETRVGRT